MTRPARPRHDTWSWLPTDDDGEPLEPLRQCALCSCGWQSDWIELSEPDAQHRVIALGRAHEREYRSLTAARRYRREIAEGLGYLLQEAVDKGLLRSDDTLD